MFFSRFRRSALLRRERGELILRPLAIACALLGFCSARLDAQLTVAQLDVTIVPSATGRVISNIIVHNAGQLPAEGVITREDWGRAENGENRFTTSGTSRNSCGALMSVFPIAFRIEPGADQIVRVAIEQTANLPKECWDIIFVEALQQKTPMTRSGLQYTFRTGVKVYVAPNGLTRDASIVGMSAEPLPRARGAQRLAIRFSNDGQIHLTASGRVEIRRLDNSVALQIPIPEFPSLPGAIRRLELDVPSTLAPGSYVALALIDFKGAQIAAGQLELIVR